MFCVRYPKAHDYLIMTKAVLRSLNIPADDNDALVSCEKNFLS